MVGFGSGFLVIMFYYFQDALLLNVKAVHVHKKVRHEQLLKSILSGIFKFQLDLFELIEEVCAMAEMHAVHKTIAKDFIVPYVILLFGTMYVIYKWIILIGGGLRSLRPVSTVATRQHSRGRKQQKVICHPSLVRIYISATIHVSKDWYNHIYSIKLCASGRR